MTTPLPQYLIEILVSLLPVLLFLAALRILDSFKLVALRPLIMTMVMGAAGAIIAFSVNSVLISLSGFEFALYSHYGSPVIEELVKAGFLVYLMARKRIGFMVDAAIYGFAIGAGFAVTENIYYLWSVADTNVLLWITRGFGTAMMHGATTAVVGIAAKNISERRSSLTAIAFVPGLLVAMTVHALFNQFYIPATFQTVVILCGLPLLMVVVFERSERSTREWLGVGFDTDREILEMITSGNLSDTKIGTYLQSLEDRFRGEILADMLCLLRIYLELSIGAKGILLMRDAGFRIGSDPEIKEKFNELKYLEKSIGRVGKLAIDPFLHISSRDLWQLHMLGKG